MKKNHKKSATTLSENKILSVKSNIENVTNNNTKLLNKICYFQDVIQKTILSAQKYKLLDIIGANDLNTCIQTLEVLFTQLTELKFPIQNNAKFGVVHLLRHAGLSLFGEPPGGGATATPRQARRHIMI